MANQKSKRVSQKVNWLYATLEDTGCARCRYGANGRAMTFKGCRSPIKMAQDDLGWQTIKKQVKKARVLCLNCAAIEDYELKIARLGN